MWSSRCRSADSTRSTRPICCSRTAAVGSCAARSQTVWRASQAAQPRPFRRSRRHRVQLRRAKRRPTARNWRKRRSWASWKRWKLPNSTVIRRCPRSRPTLSVSTRSARGLSRNATRTDCTRLRVSRDHFRRHQKWPLNAGCRRARWSCCEQLNRKRRSPPPRRHRDDPTSTFTRRSNRQQRTLRCCRASPQPIRRVRRATSSPETARLDTPFIPDSRGCRRASTTRWSPKSKRLSSATGTFFNDWQRTSACRKPRPPPRSCRAAVKNKFPPELDVL